MVVNTKLNSKFPKFASFCFTCTFKLSYFSISLLSSRVHLPLILIRVMAAFLSLPPNFKVSHNSCTIHCTMHNTRSGRDNAQYTKYIYVQICIKFPNFKVSHTSGRGVAQYTKYIADCPAVSFVFVCQQIKIISTNQLSWAINYQVQICSSFSNFKVAHATHSSDL